jgi:hypothetical protein
VIIWADFSEKMRSFGRIVRTDFHTKKARPDIGRAIRKSL